MTSPSPGADLAAIDPEDGMTVAGPEVGDSAPDFALRDQNNEVVTLSDFAGVKAVLVVFYPLAFTRTCSGELTGIAVALDAFANERVQVITVSVDSVPAHKVFAEQHDFDFPLLADFWPHGAVARRYGCFNDAVGIATRGTFLIDVNGTVQFVERFAAGATRDPRVWLDAIDALAVDPQRP